MTTDTKLEVTTQILNFDPGLYSIELMSDNVVRASGGLIVPCARLDPIDTEGSTSARAFVAALAEGQFIVPGKHNAFLRVERGVAAVLLTIYKLGGAASAPQLRVRLMQPNDDAPARKAEQAFSSLPLTLLAHVETIGDLSVEGGVWAGRPGGSTTIEGFSISVQTAGLQLSDIEYQGALGIDWFTPWISDGGFCGSRGLSLPLLGAKIRLRGDAAAKFQLRYWASFVGRGESGPFEDGALCSKDGEALEALRVILVACDAKGDLSTPHSTSGNVPSKVDQETLKLPADSVKALSDFMPDADALRKPERPKRGFSKLTGKRPK